MLGFITGRATAQVKEGRLIMSMPDAETPVVWVMDLNDATTSVLRLENDKQGFYVIKKHGGKAAETIAVYRNRRPAVRALTRATKALDKARTLSGNGYGGRSRFINALIVILFIWFALSRFWGLDQELMRVAIYPFIKDDIAAAYAAAQQQADSTNQQNTTPATPSAAARTAPGANAPAGVPLSADEALEALSKQPLVP